MISVVPFRLIFSCLLISSFATANSDFVRRSLLQTKKEIRELEREDNALEAYHLQQATLNKEQENMLLFGAEQAETVVRKFNKGTRKAQVKLFAGLWENAEGVTIVKSLATLIEISPKKADQYYAIVSEAMDVAEANGYGFKVSEALYNAMAVTDASQDHYHILDTLLYRLDVKEEEEKGSGCEYTKFLFSDAESWALDDGRGQQFFKGFDNADYLPLVECFLPECTGTAAKCCGQTKAISSGMCGCEVINKKKGTVQCDHNLFWTAPRTIWLCGLSTCEPNEKCLCGKPGSKSKTKTSKQDTTTTTKKDKSEKSEKTKKSKTEKKEKTKTEKESGKKTSKGKSKTDKKSAKDKKGGNNRT